MGCCFLPVTEERFMGQVSGPTVCQEGVGQASGSSNVRQ